MSGRNAEEGIVEEKTPTPGTIVWLDVTVEKAADARKFYEEVVGWTSSEFSMGDYSDYVMTRPGSDEPAAGICHAKGPNTKLPRGQWVVYVAVADVEASARRCVELGGELLRKPMQTPGFGRWCVIRDPFGAVMALGTPT